jgi:N-methylhydantoinase B
VNLKLTDAETAVASVDPITLAVVHNALMATAREMRDTIQRSAFSPVIYEDRDFACGLLDSEGGTMAEAPGLTLFMGTLGPCVRKSLVEIGVETIQAGDVFCVSIPAITGSHIADFAFFMPIFFEGQLFGFAASKAHMSDVGAKDPYPTDSIDAFQEGLRLPPVRLYNAGVLNWELRGIIMANSRAPETVWGDICAEIAGFRVGEAACRRLLEKYGFETITACVAEMYERSERAARAAIRALPSGAWSAIDHMDSNGIEHDKLVKIAVSVTIDSDAGEITFDFSESAPEQIGPANAPVVAVNSIARMMGKIMTSPETPANEGSFRPFKVIVGDGSIFNPGPTAPTNLYAKPLMTAVEAIVKAMAEVIPERLPAGSGGDLCSVLRYGFREDGRMWYEANIEGVGQGASKFADGESALIHIAEACSRNLPVELEEAKDPVIVERYELILDSGGAGEFRGGLGVRRDYRLQADTRVISMIERGKSPHWGIDGGKPGLRNYAAIESSIQGTREIMKTPDMPMASGDLISIRAGGGGGWGDPLLRGPQAVLRDVIEGYVSVEAALSEYGVVVDLVSGKATR